MMHRVRRRRSERRDTGTTLIELLVVMIVFSIIMGTITTAVVVMLKQQQRQTITGNDMDAGRKLIELLDRQVRYANAINTPGTGTDGNFYVEWRSGNGGQQQTCTQWRYVPTTGRVEQRSWQPPLAGNGSVTATSWVPLAFNVKLIGATPVWSITPTSALSSHEELTMVFAVSSGTPAVTTNNQVTLTAINSTGSAAPTALCQEVGRP
jgi:type II secretory pathway pseudopilin PulG